MHPRRWAPIVLLLLLACADEPQVWTRVTFEQIDSELAIYKIIQADPVANTCTRIELRQDTGLYSPDQSNVDVDITAPDNLVIYEVWIEHDSPPDYVDEHIADLCTSADYPTDTGPPPPVISGKLTFEQTHDVTGKRPCRVSFDLKPGQYTVFNNDTQMLDGLETFAISGKDIDIYDVGCPHPNNTEAGYTQLDAAYGELAGLGSVVVSSYDSSTGACVWARLLSSDSTLPSTSNIDVPGTWAYSGVRVALTEPEACVASELIDPNVDPGTSRSAGPMNSRGSVQFGSTKAVQTAGGSVDVPCTVTLDVALETYGEYFWIPDIVRLQAKGVPVAGACE